MQQWHIISSNINDILFQVTLIRWECQEDTSSATIRNWRKTHRISTGPDDGRNSFKNIDTNTLTPSHYDMKYTNKSKKIYWIIESKNIVLSLIMFEGRSAKKKTHGESNICSN